MSGAAVARLRTASRQTTTDKMSCEDSLGFPFRVKRLGFVLTFRI